MFELGWSEMAVVAFLALIVVGPKDLPRLLRTIGQYVRRMRSMAADFQHTFEDMAHELDLEDARKAYRDVKSFNVEKHLDPDGEVKDSASSVKKIQRELEEDDDDDEEAEDLDARARARETALARADEARRAREVAAAEGDQVQEAGTAQDANNKPREADAGSGI